jgi:hypothetical protein
VPNLEATKQFRTSAPPDPGDETGAHDDLFDTGLGFSAFEVVGIGVGGTVITASLAFCSGVNVIEHSVASQAGLSL